jgi:hypothetical protein
MAQQSENDEAITALRRFTYRIAGPREVVINVLINGGLAWWFFGSRSATPLTGSGSIFAMLLPMCFILSTLTTFFGLLAGRTKWQQLQPGHEAVPLLAWLRSGWVRSLLMGLVGLALALASQAILDRLFPTAVLSPGQVIATIAVVAGVLAFVLHTRAILVAAGEKLRRNLL